MKNILLTFDVEEFDVARAYNVKVDDKDYYMYSQRGLNNVLEILNKYNAKASFFTTLNFALNSKNLIKNLIKDGHEIALHGYAHDHNYRDMEPKLAYKYLKEAKDRMEGEFRTKIIGFRAPNMHYPSYDILRKLGIKYDSSFHPTFAIGHYNNLFKSRKIRRYDDFRVIPASVAPFFRLPIAWVCFRNFGLDYSKILTRMIFLDDDFVNIYLHPWEFVDLNKNFKGKFPFYITRNTGEKFCGTLDKYIKWGKKNKFKFITIKKYFNL